MKFNAINLIHNISEEFEYDAIAIEAAMKIDTDYEKSFEIRNKYYPLVVNFLPKTEQILFRHISNYRNKNIEILSSPYLTMYTIFTPADREILYKCCGIDPEELRKDMKLVPTPNGDSKRHFNTENVTMLLMLRYYRLTKQEQKFKLIYTYLAYSMFWIVFKRSFRKFNPNEAIMVYTINNLSNKFVIKQKKNVEGLLIYGIEGSITLQMERIERLSDVELWYIMDDVRTRLGGYVKSIATEFYRNYDEKNVIFESSTIYDNDGNQRVDESTSANVESLAQSYTTNFFANKIDKKCIIIAARLAQEISKTELLKALETLKEDKNAIEEVYKLYSSLFYLYLTSDDSTATRNNIESAKFLAAMKVIFKKGNSKDPNIIAIRNISNEWLVRGSKTCRETTRPATLNKYRLGIYYYFILLVSLNS